MSTNAISTNFKFKGLLKYAFPSIIMMMFTSMYVVVDAVFIARFIGTDALSALNITHPIFTLFGAIGFMFATGGSALVGALLGEKRDEKASRTFSFITIVALSLITVLSIVVYIFAEPFIRLLGANDVLLPYGLSYLRTFLFFMPALILQFVFQSFFITAGKPSLGLFTTVGAGLFNIVFDYIFIEIFKMGVSGAALASGLSACIPTIVGLIFFFRNKGGLHFTVPLKRFWIIRQTCINGSSEMVTNLSGGVVILIFNLMMMKYIGSDGVAAISVIMSANFLMIALFLGFAIGVSPVISYHFGSRNINYLHKLQKMCFTFIICASFVIFATGFLGAPLIADAFVERSSDVNELVRYGMKLFSFAFLFCGINIFASAHFTALSDGKTSAFIAFSRTFVFILTGIYLMTRLFGMNGMWVAIPFAEFMTAILVLFIYMRRAKKMSIKNNEKLSIKSSLDLINTSLESDASTEKTS